jgi:hypothetical protein
MNKEWPPIPITEYLKPCPKRIEFNNKFVCEIISDAIGHPMGVNQVMCAQCMIFGQQQNMAFVEVHIKRSFMELLSYLPFGFYNTARAEEIIRTAYVYMQNEDRNTKHLAKVIEACVETGVLPLSTAETMVKDMPKLESV